jgi:effector-binding domain-containing protein
LVVKQVETPVLKAITLRKNGVKMQDISQVLGQAYGQIGAYLTSRNATMDSSVAPFAIYHKWDTTTFTTDIEIGMAVSAEVPGSGELKYRTFPVGRAAMVTFYGSYEQTPAAHMAVEAYLKQNNLQMAGSPWEFYVTDPMSERDTAKWRTDIYYPIP